MRKVSCIPEDYNSVTRPYLIIKGAAQATEYYKKVFGATETVRMNGLDGKVGHAELKIDNSHIMLVPCLPMGARSHVSQVMRDLRPGDRRRPSPDSRFALDLALHHLPRSDAPNSPAAHAPVSSIRLKAFEYGYWFSLLLQL